MKKTTMLKKNYEFKAVLTKGKCFKEKEIEIFILKNNKKRNFLGIAIGTKNGKAFQRNRAKRIIRESYTKLEEKIIRRCKQNEKNISTKKKTRKERTWIYEKNENKSW